MKEKAAKKVVLPATSIWWDWKEQPNIKELQKALKPFGVHVTEDPALDGTDSYGLLFSSRKLTKKELNDHAKGFWGEE